MPERSGISDLEISADFVLTKAEDKSVLERDHLLFPRAATKAGVGGLEIGRDLVITGEADARPFASLPNVAR